MSLFNMMVNLSTILYIIMSIGASYENKHTTTLCYISYNPISLQFCNLTLGGNFRQTIRNVTALYLSVHVCDVKEVY